MRLFIATSFPGDVLRDLNDRVAPLKPRLPPASWVKPETQHLTFAFLGEQPESVVERIDIDGGAAFEATLHGCGMFGRRVAWVGVEPRDAFIALGSRVRDALKRAAITFDDKPFKPHLTLARVRAPWPAAAVGTFASALRDWRSAPFAVASVILYASRLSPAGAIHTPLRTFGLSA